jgi:hypothetical protein
MTMTTSSLSERLEIIEVKPGLRFGKGTLMDLLPDVETALFFGKVYELDAAQLGVLLTTVLQSDVVSALLSEGGMHSHDLQDYVVDLTTQIPAVDKGDVSFGQRIPQGEILPQLWEMAEVEVAASIKAVAEKLATTVDHMPGKQGQMMFQSMRVMNAKRPVLGDYKARIHHAPQKENLVILDVSGSMTSGTVQRIIDDVVGLSYMANAHLAIVSNTTTHWDPGSYGSDDVLARAEFGGTFYETLEPLFDRDWGVVVTIADYDSSYSAQGVIARCTGHIDQVLDISLVNRPTFLAEVVGQLADDVRPLLIANTSRVLKA